MLGQLIEQPEKRRLSFREIGLQADELRTVLHVARRHEFGRAHIRHLGDSDGPLLQMELQAHHAIAMHEGLLRAAPLSATPRAPGGSV